MSTVSTEEALAEITTQGGTRLCRGVAVPPYVIGEKDLARWAHSQRWAADTLGLPPSHAAVQQMTRTLYNDREQYPD